MRVVASALRVTSTAHTEHAGRRGGHHSIMGNSFWAKRGQGLGGGAGGASLARRALNCTPARRVHWPPPRPNSTSSVIWPFLQAGRQACEGERRWSRGAARATARPPRSATSMHERPPAAPPVPHARRGGLGAGAVRLYGPPPKPRKGGQPPHDAPRAVAATRLVRQLNAARGAHIRRRLLLLLLLLGLRARSERAAAVVGAAGWGARQGSGS